MTHSAFPDGSAVLLDGKAGRYWQLNETGNLMLKHLLSGQSATETARLMGSELPVSPAQLEHDLAILITQLESANLVRRKK
ncbi:PqqD family peptide modification chaperone [Allosaccharopolyspora coralli]|uniref:PqqD family peptide modification chaperone n=1 Tax=Allosaccharopolyspora coralli TaxID=2665642 RepID=UPI001E4FED9C|nr:PqqD family peptide modification chaperone [Allosaccharopolyspora coralli]